MKKILLITLVFGLQIFGADQSIDTKNNVKKDFLIHEIFNELEQKSIKFNVLVGLGEVTFGLMVLPEVIKDRFSYREESLELYNFNSLNSDIFRTCLGLLWVGKGSYDLVVKVPCLVVNNIKKRMKW